MTSGTFRHSLGATSFNDVRNAESTEDVTALGHDGVFSLVEADATGVDRKVGITFTQDFMLGRLRLEHQIGVCPEFSLVRVSVEIENLRQAI